MINLIYTSKIDMQAGREKEEVKKEKEKKKNGQQLNLAVFLTLSCNCYEQNHLNSITIYIIALLL